MKSFGFNKTMFWTFGLFLLGAVIYNINSPLQGTHAIRQSDTTFAAYSYCIESTEFLKPKVAHRGLSSGIAIGEFPLYSYVMSLPCQIRGSWSEWDPKFLILLLWILNLFFWLRWAKKYLKIDPYLLGLLFGFSTFNLFFMTISLPDNLAILLVAIALNLNRPWLSLIVFSLAFAIRPYLIPLAILVSTDRKWLISQIALCLGIYFFWYKWWVLKSELNYYYTAIPPLTEMLSALPHYFLNLVEVILREWFHYLFILLLIWKRKSLKAFELLGMIFSILLVIAVRGEHLVVHSYYLWTAYIFCFLCLARTMASLTPKLQKLALLVYVLIGFAQTQHEFHRQAEFRSQEIKHLLEKNKVPESAKIAVYVGEGSCSTHYLYWMKRHGWCFYEKEFQGADHCPSGADYYLKFTGDQPLLNPCILTTN